MAVRENTYGRVRGKESRRRLATQLKFRNPYPWMSATEARVHLFLEGLDVPFSHRNFDGDAVQFKELMPDYVPEFTLSEYRIVFIVLGTYFGSIPGVLDNAGLAQAILEADGWKVIILWESDILIDLERAVFSKAPELAFKGFRGGPKGVYQTGPNEALERRRQAARSLAFKQRKFYSGDQAPYSRREGGRRRPQQSTRERNTRVRRARTYTQSGDKSLFRGRFKEITKKQYSYYRKESPLS